MVLASSASLLKGVLGSLTGFTRWQRQYSDLAQPPAVSPMCRRGKTNSQLRKKPRLQHQGHDLASMLLLRWSKLQTVIQEGDLSPLWLFIPIFTSHFASIEFPFQHHIFLFQCFLRHLGVDPASHLVDVQWCHARLTYKLNSTFSCFGP